MESTRILGQPCGYQVRGGTAAARPTRKPGRRMWGQLVCPSTSKPSCSCAAASRAISAARAVNATAARCSESTAARCWLCSPDSSAHLSVVVRTTTGAQSLPVIRPSGSCLRVLPLDGAQQAGARKIVGQRTKNFANAKIPPRGNWAEVKKKRQLGRASPLMQAPNCSLRGAHHLPETLSWLLDRVAANAL